MHRPRGAAHGEEGGWAWGCTEDQAAGPGPWRGGWLCSEREEPWEGPEPRAVPRRQHTQRMQRTGGCSDHSGACQEPRSGGFICCALAPAKPQSYGGPDPGKGRRGLQLPTGRESPSRPRGEAPEGLL